MRKSYTPSDREALYVAVKGGEAVQSAARRLGVTMTTAYKWMRTGAAEGVRVAARPTFVELWAPRRDGVGFVVRVGAAEIEVQPGFDGVLLRAIVDALRDAA